MLFLRPLKSGIAKILAHVLGVKVSTSFFFIHLFDDMDTLGTTEFWGNGGWGCRRGCGCGYSGGGGHRDVGSASVCNCGTGSGHFPCIRSIQTVRVFWEMTGHMALLTAPKTPSLFPKLDVLFVSEFLEWNGCPFDFHWNYSSVGVSTRGVVLALSSLEQSRIT